jgi:DNA repair protein RecO
MTEYLTKAIVLDKKTIKETNGLVSVFTEQSGKIKVISQGLKKITGKFSHHLEPMNLINCLVFSQKNIHIKGIITEKTFPNIRKNELSLQIALKSLKILDNSLIETEKDLILWNKLNGFLNTLDNLSLEKNELKIQYSMIYFLIKLLEILGEIPNREQWKKYFNKNNFLSIDEIIKKKKFNEIDFNILKKGNILEIQEKISNIFNNLYQ